MIACIMLSLASALMAQAPSIPNSNQVTRIGFFSPKGWIIDFSPDGSVKFSYGSSPMDMAKAPGQSFSLHEIFNLIDPYLLNAKKDDKSIGVSISVVGETLTRTLYLEDKDAIKKIISLVCEKAVSIYPDRFNELLKKYPPVENEPFQISFVSTRSQLIVSQTHSTASSPSIPLPARPNAPNLPVTSPSLGASPTPSRSVPTEQSAPASTTVPVVAAESSSLPRWAIVLGGVGIVALAGLGYYKFRK